MPPTSQLRAALWHQTAPNNHATHIMTHCRQQLTRSEPPRLRGLSVDPPPDTRLLPSSDGVTSLFRPLWFAVSLANSLHAMPKPSAPLTCSHKPQFQAVNTALAGLLNLPSRLASIVCMATVQNMRF